MKKEKGLTRAIIITAALTVLFFVQLQLIWCCAIGPWTGLGGLVIVGGIFGILVVALIIELAMLLIRKLVQRNQIK